MHDVACCKSIEVGVGSFGGIGLSVGSFFAVAASYFVFVCFEQGGMEGVTPQRRGSFSFFALL